MNSFLPDRIKPERWFVFLTYEVKNLKRLCVKEKRMTTLARYLYEREKVFVSKRKVTCVKEKRYFCEGAKDDKVGKIFVSGIRTGQCNHKCQI